MMSDKGRAVGVRENKTSGGVAVSSPPNTHMTAKLSSIS